LSNFTIKNESNIQNSEVYCSFDSSEPQDF